MSLSFLTESVQFTIYQHSNKLMIHVYMKYNSRGFGVLGFWGFGVEIQFLYNKRGRVGRHMKDLD